jgi:hypothetical protein
MEHIGLFTLFSLSSDMELMEFFIYLALLYFLPLLVAMLRGASAYNIKFIALFNILVGWIVVFWLGCLFMALFCEKEQRHADD